MNAADTAGHPPTTSDERDASMSGGDAPGMRTAPTEGSATAPDLGLFTVLQDDGTAAPGVDHGMSLDLAMRAYREIKRLRLLDARMILLQRQGRVGFYGACTGQEATPIATALALAPTDWVFPALRESVMMLVRGFPLRTYIAQVFGNSGDNQKGRQQPSHMSGRAANQVSWSSCIGTQLPQAVGAAWASKLRGDKAAVIGFLGDGATSEPDFHIALNFAGVYRVPCVVICQNNHWAISVPTSRQTASATLAVKGRAYGIPSVRVDGNDVLAIYSVVSAAVARARAGGGPTFIEALTYRIGAHSTSDDPTRYRSQEEVDRWMQRDPLLRLRRYLVAQGTLDDGLDADLEKTMNAEIAAAISEVEALPPPARESIFDDVYAELPWHLREQREELLRSQPAPGHSGG
ncbi:thiamine pyrophosphate-dependent dehydrogenase E1 component subunit alpha [Chondromyces apiculatus]|uniref:2-oxoisovalerate dehydrogenase subunit alpha n=1 Tax=Chondromyces apiculatus DSM 436 TaxID=1192034 RepID=A0A017TAI5_9BACT|nr:thiamine pyrophosphate-dependent enzyme [Chondromyces apiculatus]EYF06298.1 Branched-chain alpha-keto acid dehydrogenase, E1 component, alpha subunit [Chondromyces apiculatus DSM 436]